MALTNAEKQRRYRERLKARQLIPPQNYVDVINIIGMALERIADKDWSVEPHHVRVAAELWLKITGSDAKTFPPDDALREKVEKVLRLHKKLEENK